MNQTFEALIADTVKQAVREVLQEQPRPSRTTTDEKPTMTVKEAAAVAGLSNAKMYDLTHRQDCDFCVQVGRRKVILSDKFFDWLERQAKNGEVIE